jgi:hypothetical protein
MVTAAALSGILSVAIYGAALADVPVLFHSRRSCRGHRTRPIRHGDGVATRPEHVMNRIESAAGIMHAFAERTGISTDLPPRRYLWTDAFAVCNCLALRDATDNRDWLDLALRLIHQVHHVLGRHRPDDVRKGWISGLDEREGARHPTAGGLRIGKPLPERRASDPVDERVDWERDGQYYHYLTRWMHALMSTWQATGDVELLRYAAELAKSAHAAFVHRLAGEPRLFWKMSIDLEAAVVPSMGQHDALDGLVVTATIAARVREVPELDFDFARELAELAQMCTGRGWATSDPLGIGGLLTDALELARLPRHLKESTPRLLPRLLHDAARSMEHLATTRMLDAAATQRLPFRELGLSLGLAAVERLTATQRADEGALAEEREGDGGVEAAVERLAHFVPLRSRIEMFWLEPDHQRVETWTEHLDINAVMLATSLLPDGYLDDLAPSS